MPSSTPPSSVRKSIGNVQALIAALDHPNKEGIELLRRAILAVDPRIKEEVKWNAPSFLLEDHFATFKLHPPGAIQLVLHTGTKGKKPPRQFVLRGAEPFIRWAAPDRCVVNVGDTASARDHCQLVGSLVQQWIQQL